MNRRKLLWRMTWSRSAGFANVKGSVGEVGAVRGDGVRERQGGHPHHQDLHLQEWEEGHQEGDCPRVPLVRGF